MVAEVMPESGDLAAFSSERIPQALGDASMGHCAKFFTASHTLALEALDDIIPVVSRWRMTSKGAS